MLKHTIALVALFGLSIQLAAAQVPLANLPVGGSFITTSGQATVTATPDLAYVNTTVITNDSDASVAISANASEYQAVRDRTQAAGVPPGDIEQVSYTVQNVPRTSATAPQYPGQRYGYTVSRGVRIVVHDVARGQQIAELVASSGASGYTSVSYSLTDEHSRAQQEVALQKAVELARQEAEAAARAAGLHIVRLHLLQVGQGYAAPPMFNSGAMIGAVTSTVSVPPAQVQTHASVTATYVVSALHAQGGR